MKIEFQRILSKYKWPLLILFLTWGVYFTVLWPRIIQMRPDGLYLGHPNVWSDWALHIGIASIFAYKSPQVWFAYHPMYAGGKFTYGFLTDAISGILMRFGVSLSPAFIIPSIIFTLGLLLGMYVLLCIVLKSKWSPILAISLFFLSSGMGFINFLGPIKDYSRVDSIQWYTGNYIVGMLIPQRGFLLGMAISVWVVVGILYIFFKKEDNTNSKIILAVCGVFAGILPITQIHCFIALVIITGLLCLSFIKKWKLFLWYVIPAGVVSIFFYLIFIYGGVQNQNQNQFFVWFPGWTIKGGFWNWAKTWLYFWGAMIPMAILGFFIYWKKMSLQIKTFFLSFFVIFAFSNLFLIQPIPWDNSKLFLWAYFGFSALATLLIVWLWNKKITGKIIATVLIFFLTATGFLSLINLQRTDQNSYMETNTDDIKLGELIRKKTDPLAIFLTSTDHNSFIMMWAVRPILMGYTAWVENYGFPYQQRWEDINAMYAGGINAKNLFKKYNISYVVVGQNEINNFHANENYFNQSFSVAFQNKDFTVYDVRGIIK